MVKGTPNGPGSLFNPVHIAEGREADDASAEQEERKKTGRVDVEVDDDQDQDDTVTNCLGDRSW